MLIKPTPAQFGQQQCLCCTVCDGLDVRRELFSIHILYRQTKTETIGHFVYNTCLDCKYMCMCLTVASSVNSNAEGTDRPESGCKSALMKFDNFGSIGTQHQTQLQ